MHKLRIFVFNLKAELIFQKKKKKTTFKSKR